jgi:predicted metalloprotease with PDZ domain
MPKFSPTRYTVIPKHPEAHLFEVGCSVDEPDPRGQRFALPAWIPGSYLIRDFARNVSRSAPQSGRRSVPISKLDKHTWTAAPVEGALTTTLQVYAWDLSVRGAHLDTSHAFFNGPSVFLRPLGKEARACEVELLPPRGARYRNWRGGATMQHKRAPAFGFGLYRAATTTS